MSVTAWNSAGSATAVSSRTAAVAGSTISTSIYWGAYIDGNDTYDPSWTDAPWDDKTWSKFETNAGKKASIIHWGWGASPFWQRDFSYHQGTLDKVTSRGALNFVDAHSGSVPLKEIASGVYDAPLRTWAQKAAAWGKPFFFRFDWEMNGSWFPWGRSQPAGDFVAAWRRFHDIAEQAGARNITWVWCPNIDTWDKLTPYSQLYPGDAYVDWTCLDGYNQSSRTAWETFSQVFGVSYGKLLNVAPTKPIMVGETSSEETGGSKAAWITDALARLPAEFPKVKAFVWFNWRIYENSAWRPWQIESSVSAQSAFSSGIASAYFRPGGSYGSLPALTKIQP
jgi:hypothetical protein